MLTRRDCGFTRTYDGSSDHALMATAPSVSVSTWVRSSRCAGCVRERALCSDVCGRVRTCAVVCGRMWTRACVCTCVHVCACVREDGRGSAQCARCSVIVSIDYRWPHLVPPVRWDHEEIASCYVDLKRLDSGIAPLLQRHRTRINLGVPLRACDVAFAALSHTSEAVRSAPPAS